MTRLCGIRPTGQLHIGHYFSVILPSVELDADVLIAQYHAPKSSDDDIAGVFNTLGRFCVQLDKIILQSSVFDAKVYFRLLSIARVGELNRMTQYMSGDENDSHLLVYPVLMAHDVIGYDEILVGEDQQQHLNYARTLIKRYNKEFCRGAKVPSYKLIGGRVMDLIAPTRKMSKSGPSGCLFLDDTDEEINRKIKAATMTKEGIENLTDIYRKLGGKEEIPEMNSKFKPMVAEILIHTLKK